MTGAKNGKTLRKTSQFRDCCKAVMKVPRTAFRPVAMT
jgi:hypothetical protein